MRFVLMLTAFIAATLALPSALAGAESQAGTGDGDVPEEFRHVVNADQYAEIERFLELVKHPGIYTLRPSLGGQQEGPEQSEQRQRRFLINSKSGWDYASLTYDNRRQLVVGYHREATPEDSCDDCDIRVKGADDAYAIAKVILPYYGLTPSIDEYTITLETFDPGVPGMKESKYWLIEREFVLNGLPCRGSLFRCTVSCGRAIIDFVMYEEVVEPAPADSTISREQARELAVGYLNRSRDIRYYAQKFEVRPSDEAREVIAKPSWSWHSYDDDGSTAKQVDFTKAYFCWEIPFDEWSNVTGLKSTEVLWIRKDTGKLIGGDLDKWGE